MICLNNGIPERTASMYVCEHAYRRFHSGERPIQAKRASDFLRKSSAYFLYFCLNRTVIYTKFYGVPYTTDYEDIRTLLYDNLYKHLKKNGITDATLTNSRGEVEFSMSNPKYKQIP